MREWAHRIECAAGLVGPVISWKTVTEVGVVLRCGFGALLGPIT